MSGSGRDALTGGREAFPGVREWSGVPPGCLGMVVRPSRMYGSGREALLDVLEWSGVPHGWSGGPSWVSSRGREALPHVR